MSGHCQRCGTTLLPDVDGYDLCMWCVQVPKGKREEAR